MKTVYSFWKLFNLILRPRTVFKTKVLNQVIMEVEWIFISIVFACDFLKIAFSKDRSIEIPLHMIACYFVCLFTVMA